MTSTRRYSPKYVSGISAINMLFRRGGIHPSIAVTNAKPKAQWAAAVGGQGLVHLVRNALVAWPDEHPPVTKVIAECGTGLTSFQLVHAVPDDREACDYCLLTDFANPSVYRLYDESERLVYVGYSSNPLVRLNKHRHVQNTTSPWWKQVRSCRIEGFASENLARAAEAKAIATESPLANVQRGRWRSS